MIIIINLDLDIQDLRLIEAGLELRNANNIKVLNEKRNVPLQLIQSCEEECNKIIKIQEKIQKVLYRK